MVHSAKNHLMGETLQNHLGCEMLTCSGCREQRESSGLVGAKYFNCRRPPSNLSFVFVSIYSASLFLICLLISDLHPFLSYSSKHLIKGTLYLHVKNSEFRPVVETSKHRTPWGTSSPSWEHLSSSQNGSGVHQYGTSWYFKQIQYSFPSLHIC